MQLKKAGVSWGLHLLGLSSILSGAGCEGSLGTNTDSSVRRDSSLVDGGIVELTDAYIAPGTDAFVMPGTDAYVAPGTDAYVMPGTDAYVMPGNDTGPSGPCFNATRLWFDDFESGSYARWTGSDYGNSWGNACQSTATQAGMGRGGSRAERSEIVCASTEDVHRGYGGLQFSGDNVVPAYTNTGMGIQSANGVVSTFWLNVRAGYRFENGRWLSTFTINPSCDYSTRVLTVGLDQADGILRPAHYWPEGSLEMSPGAPPLTYDTWHRITVFLNLSTGVMHAWQDGTSVFHVTGIVRPRRDYCQWHWGLYASGNNTDVVLLEDDMSAWKLNAPWTDFSREPYFGVAQPVCE